MDEIGTVLNEMYEDPGEPELSTMEMVDGNFPVDSNILPFPVVGQCFTRRDVLTAYMHRYHSCRGLNPRCAVNVNITGKRYKIQCSGCSGAVFAVVQSKNVYGDNQEGKHA